MFPTKILLATDGSEESVNAGRTAAALSKKTDSELHVVYVEPLPHPYALSEATIYYPEMRDEVRQTAQQEAREKLAAEVEKIGATCAVAGSHARIGHPDAEISHLAEQIGAGLIVVGSRGLGPVRRLLLGSVSSSVVRHAHGPVLVVRDGVGALPGRILLAVDGSRESRLAVRAAAELSAKTGAEVHVAHVLPSPERMYGPHFYAADAKGSLLERVEREAREFLDRQAGEISSAGGKVGGTRLSSGNAPAEIVKIAEELHADLTVLGSRGLGGVRRALMGSVSDSVVRHAHNPVLVVREEDGRNG
ncbi:MAG TPA: universal stress protein [Rubrobacter sp.]|nr:universal stress protein [Rubrobacter sp.]